MKSSNLVARKVRLEVECSRYLNVANASCTHEPFEYLPLFKSVARTQGRWCACLSRELPSAIDDLDMPGLTPHRLPGMRVSRIVRVAISSHIAQTMQPLDTRTSTLPTCSSARTVGGCSVVMEGALASRSSFFDGMRSFFGRCLFSSPPDSAQSLLLHIYFACFLVCNIYLSCFGEHAFASNQLAVSTASISCPNTNSDL